MTEPRDIDSIMELGPVLPIMVVDDASAAGDLARALWDGGVRAAEVTLRTPAALAAIGAMRDAAPDMIVGAGTLLTRDDIARARDAGAQFLVTPGATPSLADALIESGLPSLPGVATGSEIAALLERGITRMKFFPAEQAGGPAWLDAMAGPFPQVRFCPTGGIRPDRAPSYLALPNVPCVGGSWVAPSRSIAARDWDAIRANAQRASGLAAPALQA